MQSSKKKEEAAEHSNEAQQMHKAAVTGRRVRSTTEAEQAEALGKMSGAVRVLLECIGEDPAREGLVKTPERMAKALLFFSQGYEQDVEEIINGALFSEDHDDMVIVRDIDVYSLCEHHMIPFYGKAHIGYIPNGKVVGLSKLARAVEVFARRLQVQERMTVQIAKTLMKHLAPLGVGVVLDCAHMCMCMRGVQKASARTITSHMLGVFRDDSKTRSEFLDFIRMK